MEKFDIFISYKQTDINGECTEDYAIAKSIYDNFKEKNLSVFFSEQSLFTRGISDYKKGIDLALDNTKVLVVIATQREYLISPWIEYEYESFYEDILSGRNEGASIVSYTKNIMSNQLPRTLARMQNYSMEQFPIEKFCHYIENVLGTVQDEELSQKNIEKQQKNQEIKPIRTEGKSIYASDYSNELKRLEIQAENARASDQIALDYLFEKAKWDKDERLCVLDIGSAYGYVAADRFSKLESVEKVLCIDKNQRVLERASIIFAENTKMIFEVLDVESETFEDDMKELFLKHNIPKVHIVFSALTLHHLNNPDKVLRTMRRLMDKDSYIVLRGSDDGSKLCHGGSELLESIIKKTSEAVGVSDRYNGRKIYTQLVNAGFADVRMFSCMKDTSQMCFEDRIVLFEESFSYRVNYFKRALENNPNDKTAEANLKWMKDALDEFENCFFHRDFWYCEYDYMGVGRK